MALTVIEADVKGKKSYGWYGRGREGQKNPGLHKMLVGGSGARLHGGQTLLPTHAAGYLEDMARCTPGSGTDGKLEVALQQ